MFHETKNSDNEGLFSIKECPISFCFTLLILRASGSRHCPITKLGIGLVCLEFASLSKLTSRAGDVVTSVACCSLALRDKSAAR